MDILLCSSLFLVSKCKKKLTSFKGHVGLLRDTSICDGQSTLRKLPRYAYFCTTSSKKQAREAWKKRETQRAKAATESLRPSEKARLPLARQMPSRYNAPLPLDCRSDPDRRLNLLQKGTHTAASREREWEWSFLALCKCDRRTEPCIRPMVSMLMSLTTGFVAYSPLFPCFA